LKFGPGVPGRDFHGPRALAAAIASTLEQLPESL
jgi:hypothetical protein